MSFNTPWPITEYYYKTGMGNGFADSDQETWDSGYLYTWNVTYSCDICLITSVKGVKRLDN